MTAFFADTFYWVALTSTDDPAHERAMALSRSLTPEKIITTDDVLCEYLSYDALGRVTASSQTTGGTTYSFSNYSYNLADALTSETYPSGRVIRTCYDGANRVSQVGGASCTSTTGAYAANFAYAVHGAPTQYAMGNGIVHEPSYDAKLNMSGLIEVNAQTGTQLLNATWLYGAYYNGNLQCATYINGGGTFNQTFTYDGVNRLQTANENTGGTNNQCQITGGAASWSRSFGYDAFGNMTPSGNPAPPTVAFNTNNQIATQTYDQAGNLLTVNGNVLSYDYDNMVVTETDGVSQAVETYVYDGQGHRVEKYGPNGTPKTVFVYDALGQLTAEYSTVVNTSPCATCYLSADYLGTPRLVTDGAGNLIGRHDYLPFGEELQAGTFGRDGQWGPGNDVVGQKFTGKERDAESGLDYFGARYYGSALGRFTSPDKPLVDQFVYNPQSWNLYSYVRNNPLAFIDRTGNCSIKPGQSAATDDPGSPCVKAGDTSTTVYANEDIANAARSQVGSWTWLYRSQKDNFACNTNKCNKGVADWIAMAGKSTPGVPKKRLTLFGIEIDFGTREPTAHEWADPSVQIDGWSAPMSVALAVPGDVIAQAHGNFGHVGIVADPGQTVSVNSTTTPEGIVTENNWGFRSGALNANGLGGNGEHLGDKPPVVRKYIGKD